MAMPMDQKFVKSGTIEFPDLVKLIYETAGWIYTNRSSIELSKPVIVQHRALMTLNSDFPGQVWKGRITVMQGTINMERKRCESMRSGTHFVAINFHLSNDNEFSMSKF